MIKYILLKISTSFSSHYYHLDARCLFSENVVERYGITHSNKTKMREIFNKTSSILATDSIQLAEKYIRFYLIILKKISLKINNSMKFPHSAYYHITNVADTSFKIIETDYFNKQQPLQVVSIHQYSHHYCCIFLLYLQFFLLQDDT